MPNHCTNTVKITHSDTVRIKELKDKLRTTEHDFDFNAILPMPDSLNLEAGGKTDLGMAVFDDRRFAQYQTYNWFAERYPTVTTKEELGLFLAESDPETLRLGKIAVDNIKQYGAATWYEWAIENWGTKWNAYEVTYYNWESDEAIEVKFQTAWAPPEGVFNKLRDDGFAVNGYWYEEGGEEGYIGSGDGVYVSRTIEVEFE